MTGAGVRLVDVDHDLFVRLELLAVGALFEDDPRLRDHQLVALAAHGLDEHGQVQLAAARDLEGVGRFGLVHAQRDVGLHLFEQALAQVARGDELALRAGERAVVRDELHLHGRLFDVEQRQHDRAQRLGDRLADGELLHAGDGADVAGGGLGELEALERLVAEDLRDAELLALAVAVDEQRAVALAHAPGFDAADGDVAEVVVVVERGHAHRQRRVTSAAGGGTFSRIRSSSGAEVLALVLEILHRPALAARGVDDREVELRVGRAERAEEIEGRVDGALGIAARAVDLVDDQDRAQAQRERLAGHEAGLRHRPFVGVDEQADRVDHPQHALDLAAEVGVARRIDDVDAHPLPGDRGELRQDRDAALALELVRVHRAVGDDLAGAEAAGLAQEAVDERGLAVVDVRDDRDVADVAAHWLLSQLDGGRQGRGRGSHITGARHTRPRRRAQGAIAP